MSNNDANTTLESSNNSVGGSSTSSNQLDSSLNSNSADCGGKSLKDPTSEHGGPKGLEPTRYGDWEKAGRCIDF